MSTMQSTNWGRYRKSIRKYQETPLSDKFLGQLTEAFQQLNPLLPNEPYDITMFSQEEFAPLLKGGFRGKFAMVQGPHYLLLQCANTPRGKLNLGYVGEHVVKVLTQQNCGTCWLGGPSFSAEAPVPASLSGADVYRIAIVFGTPEAGEVKLVEQRARKTPEAVCPQYSTLSEALQEVVQALISAPTAMNHQAWKLEALKSNGLGQMQFSYKVAPLGLVKKKLVNRMIPLDMGIGLFHMLDRAEELGLTALFTYTPKGATVGTIAISGTDSDARLDTNNGAV